MVEINKRQGYDKSNDVLWVFHKTFLDERKVAMWNLTYKTQDTYIEALQHACEEKNVSDTDEMIKDFRKYFEKKNKEYIGDMEVIKSLPEAEAIASQYENKAYCNKRQLMKEGSAGGGKRFGIGLLSVLVRLFSLIGYVALIALLFAGLASIAVAGIFQFGFNTMLPQEIQAFSATYPSDVFVNYLEGRIFLVALGIFIFFLAGTLIQSLRCSIKKYRHWVLRSISGCYRLPVSLHNIHSKLWRVLVYIFVPLSLVVLIVTGIMVFFGISF